MVNEEQMKEKYMQFQAIQQQLEQVNEHLETLTQQSQEVDISINAIKEIGKTEEGSKLHMLSSMADSLKNESWYVQALASKLLPAIEKASKSEPIAKIGKDIGMGLRK